MRRPIESGSFETGKNTEHKAKQTSVDRWTCGRWRYRQFPSTEIKNYCSPSQEDQSIYEKSNWFRTEFFHHWRNQNILVIYSGAFFSRHWGISTVCSVLFWIDVIKIYFSSIATRMAIVPWTKSKTKWRTSSAGWDNIRKHSMLEKQDQEVLTASDPECIFIYLCLPTTLGMYRIPFVMPWYAHTRIR